MAIVLPNLNRRAWRRGFWVTLALVLGVMTGVVLWGLSPWQRAAAALITTGVAAAPGLLRPRLASMPMQIWNRLARLFAHAATAWITAVCFYVVVRALGRGQVSSLRLTEAAAGQSLWAPWQDAAGHAGSGAAGIVAVPSPARGWAGDVAAWARSSGNLWAWCLLPFLLVLAALETGGDVEAPPPGIYTLY
jgi:hypothetical protein